MFNISPVPNNVFGFCFSKNLTNTNIKNFMFGQKIVTIKRNNYVDLDRIVSR